MAGEKKPKNKVYISWNIYAYAYIYQDNLQTFVIYNNIFNQYIFQKFVRFSWASIIIIQKFI